MASNNGSAGKWEVVKKGKKSNNSAGGGKNATEKKPGGRKALGESNQPSREPLKMSETLYDGFEKMGKKQNKEQVPPPAETESKKPSSKPSKKSQSSSTVAPATHKTLEEAFKAVSNAHTSVPFFFFFPFPGCGEIGLRNLLILRETIIVLTVWFLSVNAFVGKLLF